MFPKRKRVFDMNTCYARSCIIIKFPLGATIKAPPSRKIDLEIYAWYVTASSRKRRMPRMRSSFASLALGQSASESDESDSLEEGGDGERRGREAERGRRRGAEQQPRPEHRADRDREGARGESAHHPEAPPPLRGQARRTRGRAGAGFRRRMGWRRRLWGCARRWPS